MAQHQQLSILGHLTTEQHRHGTQNTARDAVRERQKHPARISARPSNAARAKVTGPIVFPSPTGAVLVRFSGFVSETGRALYDKSLWHRRARLSWKHVQIGVHRDFPSQRACIGNRCWTCSLPTSAKPADRRGLATTPHQVCGPRCGLCLVGCSPAQASEAVVSPPG